MENQFDLGLNIASIETELPDPVITLTGADSLTASDTAEMPLLALTAYGRSWQDKRAINIADVGVEGHGIPVSSDGNYTDSSGQQWICDELIYNANGTGKAIKRIKYKELNGSENWSLNDTVDSTRKRLRLGLDELAIYGSNFYVHSPSLVICDEYKSVTNGNTAANIEGISVSHTAGYIAIYDENFATATIDEWKAHLAENPITVIYALNTPQETELTAEQITALQPIINKYGVFTAYFMSTQDGVPTPENPVEIISTSDLHRVSVPIKSIADSGSLTVTTCGKNRLKNTATTITNNGVTFTVNADGSVTANGTASDTAYIIISSNLKHLEVGKLYKMFGCPSGGGANSYSIQVTGVWSVDFGEGAIFKYQENVTTLAVYVAAGVTVSDVIFTPMICDYETIDNTFEPYQSTTATITTALPLRGIPVSSGGNYTDSNGQEWICDTIEHVYGEPAQAVKRIKKATVNGAADSHGKAVDSQGYSCVCISYALSSTNALLWYGDYGVYYPYSDGVGGEFRIFADTKQGLIELRDLTTWEVTQTETFTGNKMVGNEITAERFELFGNWQNADERKQPLFTLDSGDPVPEIYISTTGQLNDGAEIIYPSEPQAVMLTTEETEAMNRLSGYEGSTTVYNENTAEMTVKLLREDFEMQYIHWIKESQSFICEKSGKYKIICVGGGSSGGIGAPGAADVLQAVGTTTSFGSIISANGGGKSRTSASEKFEATGTVGGQSGYDGINYGSSSHILSSTGSSALSSTGSESTSMWGTGHGYGAGGGAKGMLIKYTKDTAVNLDMLACGGQCGRIESTIVDLEENQTVFCTVGGGGALNLSDANVLDYLKNYVDNAITETTAKGTELSACVTDGADGVIIVQYLGV